MTITVEAAKELIELAFEHGAQYGKAVAVAVVDAGGFLVALERQNGARPITPSIATSQAYSAAVMQRPTADLKGWSTADPTLFAQVAGMGMYPILASPGGVPVKRQGELLGGLGVAGALGTEDQAISEAALTAAGYELSFDAWPAVQR